MSVVESVNVGHMLTEGHLLTEGQLLAELVCDVETLTVRVLVTVTVAEGDHVCALTPGTNAIPRTKLKKGRSGKAFGQSSLVQPPCKEAEPHTQANIRKRE